MRKARRTLYNDAKEVSRMNANLSRKFEETKTNGLRISCLIL